MQVEFYNEIRTARDEYPASMCVLSMLLMKTTCIILNQCRFVNAQVAD